MLNDYTNNAIPTSFNMAIKDIQGVVFNLTNYTHPSVSLGQAQLSHKDASFKLPSNVITYDDLNLSFIVDEQLKNYLEVYSWMLRCKPLVGSPKLIHELRDITVYVLDSHKQPVLKFTYKDAFPTNLGALAYATNVSDTDVLTCDTTLAYQSFAVERVER